MRFVWATRGYNWGFRFLNDGGLSAPLSSYEQAFSGVEDERTVFVRSDIGLAVRFLDPKNRCDRSGRPIFHDLVVLGEDADTINTLDEAKKLLWQLIDAKYESLWDGPEPE